MSIKIKIIIFSTIVFLISSLPVVIGFLNTPDDMSFIGGHATNSGDINFVLSQLRQGNILVKNLFTSEIQPRIFFPTSYFLLGLIGSITNFSNLVIIQFGKFLYTVFFFFLAYKLLSIYFKETKLIWFSIIMLAFSSGFGFLLKAFISTSTDLWIAESNTFHSMLFSPNVIFSQALMLLFIILFLQKRILYSGLILMLISVEHQFDAVLLMFTIFLYCFSECRNVKGFLRMLIKYNKIYIFALSSLLIQAILIQNYPNVEAWTRQTNLTSPALLSFISGYGLVGFFSVVFMIRKSFKRLDVKWKLLFFWIISALFLIYGPIPFQRRFSEGLHIPLVILSTVPIWEFITNKLRNRKISILLFLLILISTNIYLLYLDIKGYRTQQENTQFYFYKADLESFKWLEKNTNDNDIVLADALYSPFIPYFTGRTVYFGHQVGTALTINFAEKTEKAKKFFLNDDDKQRVDFLKKNMITLLFIGKKNMETEDYKIWDSKKYLNKIYEKDGVKIFKII